MEIESARSGDERYVSVSPQRCVDDFCREWIRLIVWPVDALPEDHQSNQVGDDDDQGGGDPPGPGASCPPSDDVFVHRPVDRPGAED